MGKYYNRKTITGYNKHFSSNDAFIAAKNDIINDIKETHGEINTWADNFGLSHLLSNPNSFVKEYIDIQDIQFR